MGVVKWTYEKCHDEAIKYKTKVEFRKKNPAAYSVACRNKWLNNFVFLKELCKPRNYWTYERCYEEAKKYQCKVDFQRGKRGAYKAALRKKWLDDYTWLKTPKPKNKKWTYESCLEESKKYTTLSDFMNKSGSAYNVANKNGWISEYKWLKRLCKPNGYWNYENCYKEAKNYKTKTDFEKGNGSCYAVALKNGWLNDYYWIPKRKRVESKWTKEICFEIAHKFKTKSDFEKTEKGCYIATLRNGWLKEMDWFVPKVIEDIDRFKSTHLVYVYKDDKLNVAYVGLTSNLKVRHNRHKKSGSVFNFFSTIGKEIPQPIILKDNLTPEESRYYEDYYLQKFKNNGYNTLNKGYTGKYCGSFGGGRVIYTKEKCYEIAIQYEYLNDFIKENPSCYNRAKTKGYIKDYTWLKYHHKIPDRRKVFTFNECVEISKQFKTFKTFQNKRKLCYNFCEKMNYLNSFKWLK